jgi:integrase
MQYLENKGLGLTHVEKVDRERFITQKELKLILDTIEGGKKTNGAWKRDHALIFFGFYLALRVGEAAMLNRRHFRDIKKDTVYVPTLKQSIKIPWACANPKCGLKLRLNSKRIGEEYSCPRCRKSGEVKLPRSVSMKDLEDKSAPEKPLPFLESFVVRYIRDYLEHLDKILNPKSEWLFPSRGPNQARFDGVDTHIGEKQVLRIFGTYVIAAGLAKCYSFHSLRHGRCTMLCDAFKQDLVLVRDFARHKSTTTTQRYTRFSPENSSAAIKVLDELGKKNSLNRAIR